MVTKNPGWYGRAVQFFTGSSAFHCVTAISETEVVSAETPTVRIRPTGFFDGIEWTDEPMTPEGQAAAVAFVSAQVGKKYAYLDIVFLLIARLTKHRTPKWVIGRLQSQNRWFCSELADAGMRVAGRDLFPGRPECTVIPADFLTVERRTTAAGGAAV